MARLERIRKNPKKSRQYTKDAIEITTEVVSIEEWNKEYPDSKKCYKNVFYCRSYVGEPRMCIYWGRTSIAVGDTVVLTGRIKEGGEFLCWRITIIKKGGDGK